MKIIHTIKLLLKLYNYIIILSSKLYVHDLFQTAWFVERDFQKFKRYKSHVLELFGELDFIEASVRPIEAILLIRL